MNFPALDHSYWKCTEALALPRGPTFTRACHSWARAPCEQQNSTYPSTIPSVELRSAPSGVSGSLVKLRASRLAANEKKSRAFAALEGQAMNNGNTRAELFAALQALADIAPQMRAGQLMAAIGELCSDLHGRGLWDAEDEEFLEAIGRYRRGIEDAAVANEPSSADS
jgi:hypothetical protein